MELVTADFEEAGAYIGELLGTFTTMHSTWAKVKILACIRYPSQYAVIYKNVNVRRKPYPYGMTVRSDKWQPYNGEIPAYTDSVRRLIRTGGDVIDKTGTE